MPLGTSDEEWEAYQKKMKKIREEAKRRKKAKKVADEAARRHKERGVK
jgi:hypothetical protein